MVYKKTPRRSLSLRRTVTFYSPKLNPVKGWIHYCEIRTQDEIEKVLAKIDIDLGLEVPSIFLSDVQALTEFKFVRVTFEDGKITPSFHAVIQEYLISNRPQNKWTYWDVRVRYTFNSRSSTGWEVYANLRDSLLKHWVTEK